MTAARIAALVYAAILAAVAAINYVPGLTDADGLAFGLFALDPFDDALHLASALWALLAGLVSHRASRVFLLVFGALYLADGLLGVATGSGFLDLGILRWGVLDQPLMLNVLTSLPHVLLGGVALLVGLLARR